MRLKLLHAPMMSEKWSSAAVIRRNSLPSGNDSMGARATSQMDKRFTVYCCVGDN